MKTIISLFLYIIISKSQYQMIATCQDSCKQDKNIFCSGKCIKFVIQDHQVPEQDLNSQQCWNINSCGGFPRMYNFKHQDYCDTSCGVTFHIVSYEDSTHFMDICLQQISEDSPVPNACKMWQAISFQEFKGFKYIGLLIIFLLLF